jgi:small conductance mechanosensitive channel
MVGSIEGTVVELGLFGTTLTTPDNVRTVVGNTKVIGNDIKNYSANPYRRVELVAQLARDADLHAAINLLKQSVAKVPNITRVPAVDVEILEFNEFGPKLAVRPYCNTEHYWQVYFDTNKTIAETLGAAGFPVATRPVSIYPVEPATHGPDGSQAEALPAKTPSFA